MQNYIPLQYDRSHLQIRKSEQDYDFFIDYFDIALIVVNIVLCLAIIAYYFATPRKSNEEIILKTSDKSIHDIPHFTYSRHGKKAKLKQVKDQKQSKDFNPLTHVVGYNLVELKCLKCTHSTQVYEPKRADNV